MQKDGSCAFLDELPLIPFDHHNVQGDTSSLLTGGTNATLETDSPSTKSSPKPKSKSKPFPNRARRWCYYLVKKFVETSLWVGLDAHLVSVDSEEQSITIDWIVFCYCPHGASASTPACPDVYIYFDQNLLRNSSTSTTDNEKPGPLFLLNAADYVANHNTTNPDYRYNSPQFRTELIMTAFYRGSRSSQSYPFDRYTSTLVLFAQSVSDNSTIPIGFGYTGGVAVGFNAKLDIYESGDFAHDVAIKNLIVTRGQVIRIYALTIVIAMWMITITFVLACIVSVFFGKGVRRGLGAASPDIVCIHLFADHDAWCTEWFRCRYRWVLQRFTLPDVAHVAFQIS
ncbi:uncharacterized protein C8Q71DRAFT_856115 [Rhodofomes roseus]|uniref:Uncharacterized protein n=1 Tax=Rhodofomes roseus TaxID=34475 RepID=A0ABQ8KN68_9APHY|nr:uncharacterized protein C8Q71DRAFT_856115 [Rhodofomes roseus]KAH9839503.1 hypothetical protein C8Q71DRAFT_856115 [Rhodofomes roseus]